MCIQDDIIVNKLSTLFNTNEFTVIEKTKNSQECIKKLKNVQPDIVILEYNLGIMNGLDVAKIILKDKNCSVLLLVSEEEARQIKFKPEKKFAFLIRPVGKYNILSVIKLMSCYNDEMELLENEVKNLKDAMEARKEIEKAKGILMKKLKLSESEAFKKIQKQSMDKGIAMVEIAKSIIIAYDI